MHGSIWPLPKPKMDGLEEALACFRQAQQDQKQPSLLNANIITILKDLNRIDEAWTELRNSHSEDAFFTRDKSRRSIIIMAEENYAEASVVLQRSHSRKSSQLKTLAQLEHLLESDEIHGCAKESSNLHYCGIQRTLICSIHLLKAWQRWEAQVIQKTQYCWPRDISELSSEHVFSRQFLEISCESIGSRSARRESGSTLGDSTTHSRNPHDMG